MTTVTRHAARTSDGDFLCGPGEGRVTEPKESVNCPMCRTILNNVRERYPEHADYDDWRLTRAQERQAARDMVADMQGGACD